MTVKARTVRLGSAAATLAIACAAALATSAGPVTAASMKAAAYPKAAVILTPRLVARTKPSRTAAAVKKFSQFRSDFRPTTLLVLGEAKGADGKRWFRVSVPARPNGRTGWVRAAAVQARPIRRSIVVDLSSRPLRVLENGRIRYKTRVAIGRDGMETPTGRFYLTATFKPRSAISARSHSRRARTRSCPSGRAAASSASTARRCPGCSERRCHTGAFGCPTRRHSSSSASPLRAHRFGSPADRGAGIGARRNRENPRGERVLGWHASRLTSAHEG
jgi:hypothetical protein